jgi:cytoskeletal protein CcmA (bactofilin family)
MALWKEPAVKDPPLKPTTTPVETTISPVETNISMGEPMKQATERFNGSPKESFISTGLTIEGKIVGHGSVRIAGQFQGELQVHGDLSIESGAQVTGEIHADTITIEGSVQGNVNATSQVTLLQSGQIVGDLKAKSLTVAAGARMRGKVEFGWEGESPAEIKNDALSLDFRPGNGSVL